MSSRSRKTYGTENDDDDDDRDVEEEENAEV